MNTNTEPDETTASDSLHAAGVQLRRAHAMMADAALAYWLSADASITHALKSRRLSDNALVALDTVMSQPGPQKIRIETLIDDDGIRLRLYVSKNGHEIALDDVQLQALMTDTAATH